MRKATTFAPCDINYHYHYSYHSNTSIVILQNFRNTSLIRLATRATLNSDSDRDPPEIPGTIENLPTEHALHSPHNRKKSLLRGREIYFLFSFLFLFFLHRNKIYPRFAKRRRWNKKIKNNKKRSRRRRANAGELRRALLHSVGAR